MQILDRKADTRTKIQMGGLVKKAGLDDLHKSNPIALLGALIEIRNKIDNPRKDDDNSYNRTIKKYEEIAKKSFDDFK